MAALISMDYETRFARFTVKDDSELQILPTTHDWGKGEMKVHAPVMQGSVAKTRKDGKAYILNEDDTWTKWSSGGGGGGGGGDIDYATDDEVKDIFGL